MDVVLKNENKIDEVSASKQREQIIKEVHRLEILPVLVDILASFSANKVNVKDLDNEFGTIRVRLEKLREVLQTVEGLGIPMDEKTKNLKTVEDSIQCKLGILESVKSNLKEKVDEESEKSKAEESIEKTSKKEEISKTEDTDVVMTTESAAKSSSKIRKPAPLIPDIRSLMGDKKPTDLLKIYNEVTQKANTALESSLQSQTTSSNGNSNGLSYDQGNNSANNKGNSEDNANNQSGDNDSLHMLKDEELMDLDQLNDGLLMMQDGEDISAVLDTMGDAPVASLGGLNSKDTNSNEMGNQKTTDTKNDTTETKKEIGEGPIQENDLDFFSKDFFSGSDAQNSNKAVSGSGITSTDQDQNFFSGGSINLSDFNLNSDLLGGSGDGAGAADMLLNDPASDSALKIAGFSGDNGSTENKEGKNAFADLNDFGFNMEF